MVDILVVLLLGEQSGAGSTGFKEKKLFPQKINNRIVVSGPELCGRFRCRGGLEGTFCRRRGEPSHID